MICMKVCRDEFLVKEVLKKIYLFDCEKLQLCVKSHLFYTVKNVIQVCMSEKLVHVSCIFIVFFPGMVKLVQSTSMCLTVYGSWHAVQHIK